MPDDRMICLIFGPDTLDAFHEAGRFGASLTCLRKGRKQFFLLFGQIGWGFDLHFDDLVAGIATPKRWHTFAAHAETPSRLGACVNRKPRHLACQRWHVNRSAHRGNGHWHWNLGHHIAAIPRKDRMRIDIDENIQIASRTAANSRFAFT